MANLGKNLLDLISDPDYQSKVRKQIDIACIKEQEFLFILKYPSDHESTFYKKISERSSFCKPEEFNLRKRNLYTKLTFVEYHFQNFEKIENQTIAHMQETASSFQFYGDQGIVASKLVAEFEAFEIQLCSSIEYFARLLAYYFKMAGDVCKLKKICAHIERKNESGSSKIIEVLEAYKDCWTKYQNQKNKEQTVRTNRDTIVHWNPIPLTTLNVIHRHTGEFIICKISPEVNKKTLIPEQSLHKEMEENFINLKKMIKETLDVLFH